MNNLVGNSTPQIPEAKASSLSGSWYMVQMDTHSDYSAYLPVDSAVSLYQMAKIWSDAGYDAVLFKDYHIKIPQSGSVGYGSNANFDDSSNFYNYSVTGSPTESGANFSTGYPEYRGPTGAGRLYVNGTGEAMVSYYHATYKGRRSLDLHRWQVITEFGLYANFSGNVATGIEIRFTSGRKLVIYQENGTSSSYSNSSTTKYFETLRGFRTVSPWTVVDVLSVTGMYLACKDDYNNYFNITKAYLETWGQANYLNDKIFDFRWFSESFDSSSWIDVYVDYFVWLAYSNWANYMADLALAESDHNIMIIAGLEVTIGPGYNQAFFFNINSSGITYDGNISQYLNLPTEASNRGGLAFIEELYMYPNGTAYPNSASKKISDWLDRGFSGRAILYKQWDNALTVCYNNEWNGTLCLPFFRGSDMHNGTLSDAMKMSYTMVYVEGALTKANLVSAIEKGRFYAVETIAGDTVRTNLTISRFDVNNRWTIGDWATPSERATLNIEVSCDVQVSSVTLVWNGQKLREWTPNVNLFSTSLDVSLSGYLRLIAKDQNKKYTTYSNPIFIKPRSPYVTETTHPLDLSSKYGNEKLTLSISAPTGQTSVTRVYCGDKGEPTQVYAINGTLTWSYNASTGILTLNVMHTGSANILVDWRIPGDVDGNGKVDASDLTELSEAYGSTLASLKWNPNCDFNGDNIISVLDLYPLGKNYGKTKP